MHKLWTVRSAADDGPKKVCEMVDKGSSPQFACNPKKEPSNIDGICLRRIKFDWVAGFFSH